VPVEWNIGDVIIDLYEVTDILGEGGMGTVYKVHHMGWNMDLAVKSPKPKQLAKIGGAEKVEQEAETWVNLGLHPNIVSCYYVRRLGGIPRLFAECVEGGSLRDWIHNKKFSNIEQMLDAAIQFAWGLQFAHEQGIIHQDVKPANVMMTNDGEVKITDFGLAKVLETGGTDQSSKVGIRISTSGMTPAYCSPEQANRELMTFKTDMWSWAVSILEIFTGKITWEKGYLAGEALEKYEATWSKDLGIHRIPVDLISLLKRCFHNDPEKRPKDMEEIANTLIELYEYLVKEIYFREKHNKRTISGNEEKVIFIFSFCFYFL